MPANVSESTALTTIESEQNAAPAATTASSTFQVNEPLSKQVPNTNGTIEESLPKTIESPITVDKVTVPWHDRLKMQENMIQLLKQEKEKQLLNIANHLMVMEAKLRKEQKRILELLHVKDETIAHQETQIQALLVLNRKLAAKMERHRNCTQCKQHMAEVNKSRHHFSDPLEMSRQILRPNNRTCRSVSDVSSDRKEENRFFPTKTLICKLALDKVNVQIKPQATTKAPKLDEINSASLSLDFTSKDSDRHQTINAKPEWSHLYAIEEVVKSYDQDSDSDSSMLPFQSFSHLQTLEELDESEEMNQVHSHQINESEPFLLGNYDTESRNHLSVSYNRVMSNHRNVTKPKDVKYKKINRVKSRSLEELRGKLRNWTPPFFLSEKPT